MTSLHVFIGEHCKNALNTLPEGAVVYLIGFDANLDGFEQKLSGEIAVDSTRKC